MQDIYAINDLEGYAQSVRDSAASSLKSDYTEDLNAYITINEVIGLVKNRSLGVDDNNDILINEDCHDQICEDISIWIYNIGLSKLASIGKIECAWDDESNEMIFWLPKNGASEKHDNEKNSGTQTRDR